MRVMEMTAPVYGFLEDASASGKALIENRFIDGQCGPWITEITEHGDEQRQFLLDWNDFDPTFCDGIDELHDTLMNLVIFAQTDSDFRRVISGVFYRSVTYDLHTRLRCGDQVDATIIRALETARKACESIDKLAELELAAMRGRPRPDELNAIQKQKRSCDRYIKIANVAYDEACDHCCMFGWHHEIERFVHKGEPCEQCKVAGVASIVCEECPPELEAA